MSVRGSLPVIGVVGGIGSGKSSVAKYAGQTRKLLILDGDRVGHELLKSQTVIQEIRKRFGDHVIDESGNVNRPVLARRVFGDSDQHHHARRGLEEILHPRIRKVFQLEIQEANETHTANETAYEAIILDAALLLEAGWQDLCTTVVFVDTPRKIRQQRVVENRGWAEDELSRRESNQLSIKQKKERSNHTVDNSGTLEAAAASLNDILDQVLKDIS